MAIELNEFPMVVRSGPAAEEVRRLVRARRLLTAAVDHHRAIVGPVSRDWILSEAERRIPWESVLPVVRPRFTLPGTPPPEKVNTNMLPKLEPMLNECVLTGVLLYGARLFGRGTRCHEAGVGCREISTDLLIASMIHHTFGMRDTLSGYLPERHRVIDADYLAEEFGDGVLTHVWTLREQIGVFDDALGRGGSMPEFSPEYATAIAAVKAARLRLTARAAGDNIFALLDEAKREELRERGIDPGARGAEFPERPQLERDYLAARAAIDLPGVELTTVREPVRDVLLRSVEHVLRHGTPARELIGKYGGAVRNFHCALPLWDHYSAIIRRTALSPSGEMLELSGPFALGTLFMTSLEVTRYLHNVRRKGGGTGAGHSFLVSARVERLLEKLVSIPVIAGSDCHDVVEDGGFTSAGYDQDLELFALRFGAPLAALVAEVTDSFTREDGPLKAVATSQHAVLLPLEHAYNFGQLAELRSRATDPSQPFTLQGIIMKLADFGCTQEEGLRDPDMMTGVWGHSGARFTWDQVSKGRIVRPLLERLRIEILVSRTDPFYYSRGGSLPSNLIERLCTVLNWSFAGSDLYQAQNLAILAREYGLDEAGWSTLRDLFFGEGQKPDDLRDQMEPLFDESRLDPEVRRRGLAATHRLVPGGAPVKDLERLQRALEFTRWRREARRELDLPPLGRDRVEEVLRRYEACTGGCAAVGRPAPGEARRVASLA